MTDDQFDLALRYPLSTREELDLLHAAHLWRTASTVQEQRAAWREVKAMVSHTISDVVDRLGEMRPPNLTRGAL